MRTVFDRQARSQCSDSGERFVMTGERLRRIVTAGALEFVAVLFVAVAALGQEPEPGPDSARVTQAISAPDVAERSEALSRQLRETRQRIAPVPEIEKIASDFDARTQTIAAAGTVTASLLDGRPTLSGLNSSERDWIRQGDELANWRRALTRRADALEIEIETLNTSEEAWIATLDAAVGSDAPQEVLDVARESIKALRSAHDATAKRRSQVLALQNRVVHQELVVEEHVVAIQTIRSDIRRRLLEPEEPPIWSAGIVGATESGANIRSAFESSRSTIRDFLMPRRARLLTLGVLFVLASLASFGLKNSIAERNATGSKVDDSWRVFRRPISLALLLSLLSIFWLFPLAPDALRNAVGLAMLVPLLRLLPSLMHPGFRRILYGVAGFYIVDRVREVLQSATPEGRIAFGLECAAAALFCAVLLHPSRLPKIPDLDRFPRWASPALRVGFGVFTAAFVANLLGFVSLAEVLGQGLLASLYIAIGLYAAVRVAGIILDVTTQTAWAQKIRFLRVRRAATVERIRWGISVVARGLWFYWSLAAFAIQDAVIEGVRGILAATLTLGSAAISLGDVLAFGLTLVLSVLLARLVRFVLLEDFFPRVRTSRGIPHAVSASAHYVILFGGFLLALLAAGIDFNRFSLLAGAFGVGIGFGLQNVVNNFVSGLILLYERPIQVGDVIDLGDLMGLVKRIGIRSSTVRSFSGAEVIVPNADLISQRVINWTLSDKTRRIDVSIGVRYGSDPDKVIEILQSVGSAHPKVLEKPPVSALFRRHGDSSLDFELRVWIANIDDWYTVESDLNTAINRALTEAGIEIPFPQRDLHLRSVDQDAARRIIGGTDDTA